MENDMLLFSAGSLGRPGTGRRYDRRSRPTQRLANKRALHLFGQLAHDLNSLLIAAYLNIPLHTQDPTS